MWRAEAMRVFQKNFIITPPPSTPPIDSFAFTLEQEEEGSKASVDF